MDKCGSFVVISLLRRERGPEEGKERVILNLSEFLSEGSSTSKKLTGASQIIDRYH